MNELFVGLRRAAVAAYRRLPGRPLEGSLIRIDRWVKHRLAGQHATVTRNGLVWELDLDQLIDRHIYLEGEFEHGTASALAALARPGATVLDIGANIGAHCLPLARRVGPDGRVFAFEPTEWAHKKLTRNLALNPELRNVRTERLALSDEDANSATYAFQSQYAAEDASHAEKGTVGFARLDTYLERAGISRVDLIKLDVDGFETKILRGGAAMLKRDRPTMIIEVSDYWQKRAGDSFDALYALLDGYAFFELDTVTPIASLPDRIRALADRDAVNVVCRAG